MAATYDWSKFTLRIDIRASINAIYEAWTSQELLELWFLRGANFTDPSGNPKTRFETIGAGDHYSWSWYGYDIEEQGKILAANGSNAFAFSFGKAGNCYIRIYEESETSICELIQSDIPTDERSLHEYHLGCKMGWTFYLSNLKCVLEGGPDLRNKNNHLQRMLNC